MSYPKREDVSPMMQEYLKTKEQYPDCLLFYRLGDFYELFFDDAKTVSQELDLTLTGKSCGLKERAPMCGVPYHAVDQYIAKLVEKGYRIAICEQMEDPRFAKGLVKREVTRIVTPGTLTSQESLDEHSNNYIFGLFYDNGGFEDATPVYSSYGRKNSGKSGIAICDVSTGEFYLTEVSGDQKILEEIHQYTPSEIVCNDAFLISAIDQQELKDRLGITITLLDSRYFNETDCQKAILEHFHVSNLSALGLDGLNAGILAGGALFQYLKETQKNDLLNITKIQVLLHDDVMFLDSSTRRNLELTQTLREKKTRGSLLWVLDKTKTAMGSRLLRHYIEQPLIDRHEVELRLDAVEELTNHSMDRDEIREYLSSVYDMERLLTKISYQSANPRDVVSFRESLKMIRPIQQVLSAYPDGELALIRTDLGDFDSLYNELSCALNDDPPLAMKEGGIIKDGFLPEIDEQRNLKNNSRAFLAKMEEEVRESTGIKNLKIKYNSVFGYFFEVTNSFKDKVPDYFERRQTLVGAERYTTPELKELENKILNAQDRLNDLEYEEFDKLRKKIAGCAPEIQKAAHAVARLDVYVSFSVVSETNGYVRPKWNDKGIIKIKGGRHPVVEQMMPGRFVSNDTTLDNGKNQIAIITGPNMAGKSTYMRQVALIVLMAQIGCFVPAESANLCIVDRIFTRVGASDDLGSGQSTFMVEMNEVANILRNATSKSLLILDEIGRGTSTYDGLSIAWAVIEYIANRKILGAKTLFATHYHELTQLEEKMDNVKNYCFAVQEKEKDLIFLRKLIRGGADRSYGIEAARLSGVPEMVIDRAKEISASISENDLSDKIKSIKTKTGDSSSKKGKAVKAYDEVELGQMSLYETKKDSDILEEIKELNIPNMTPMDALNTLYRLQSELVNRWSADSSRKEQEKKKTNGADSSSQFGYHQ